MTFTKEVDLGAEGSGWRTGHGTLGIWYGIMATGHGQGTGVGSLSRGVEVVIGRLFFLSQYSSQRYRIESYMYNDDWPVMQW